jgi:hypothetical protein
MYRTICIAVCAAVVIPLSVAVSASASAPSTMLSMTLRQPGGKAPMSGAMVSVFWNPPPGTGKTTRLPLIGSGTTSANGTISLTLNTSKVSPDDLGDIGAGGTNAFNAEIFAFDAAGHYNVTQAVIPEGQTFSYTATAGTDPATGRPAQMSAAAVRADTAAFNGGGLTLAKRRVASADRYSPITPLNSARGLHASLVYTWTHSVARQSEFELPTTEYGGVSLTGNQLEERDRGATTGKNAQGNFHEWIWAEYNFVDYFYGGVHVSYYQWEPDHFQGTVAVDNPNCCRPGTHQRIGRLTYHQPPFNRGPGGTWAVVIHRGDPPWIRNLGNRVENSQGTDFTLGSLPGGISGGHFGIADLTTYGSITSVSWTFTKGCPSGYKRAVWGHGIDPVEAGRALASCVLGRNA